MKRTWIVSVTLCLLAACFCVLPVQATETTEATAVTEASGIPVKEGAYTYSVTDGKATIIACEKTVGGALQLPAKLGGYPVVSIGMLAFDRMTGLSSITIPDSVTTISDYAFRGCNKVLNLTIGKGVTTIGNYAFSGCTSLTNITIPDSVTVIGDSAFADCTRLTTLTIGKGVKTIGASAFEDCDWLKELTMGKAVTDIGSSAFSGCEKLSHMDIPAGVTHIGDYAFRDCKALTCIVIPSGISTIGNGTFRGCTNLSSILLPQGMDTIGDDAFYNCSNLKTVYHKGTRAEWNWIIIEAGNSPLEKAKILNDFKGTALSDICDHSYAAWEKINDTDHQRICSVCGKKDTAEHIWESEVTKKATCKDTGIKTLTCKDCKAVKKETVAKLATHTYDNACDTDCNICGLQRVTTHDYLDFWSKDDQQHWHACSVCKDKTDAADHTPGGEATETTPQLCTICGYVIQSALGHTHSYEDVWTTDQTGHWYVCAGCDEKGSYAEHVYDNGCDTECADCGYTRQTKHTYPVEWVGTETGHYQECTECGEKTEELAHIAGPEIAGTTVRNCTICDMLFTPAPVTEPTEPPTEPVTQPTQAPTEPVTEPTQVPTESVEPQPTEPDKNDKKKGGGAWILIVVIVVMVLAACGGTVAFVIYKKKQEQAVPMASEEDTITEIAIDLNAEPETVTETESEPEETPEPVTEAEPQMDTETE